MKLWAVIGYVFIILELTSLTRFGSRSALVTRYQTSPTPLVSTSAQYGAMIGVPVKGNAFGVNVDRGPSKVMSPLLFTYMQA